MLVYSTVCLPKQQTTKRASKQTREVPAGRWQDAWRLEHDSAASACIVPSSQRWRSLPCPVNCAHSAGAPSSPAWRPSPATQWSAQSKSLFRGIILETKKKRFLTAGSRWANVMIYMCADTYMHAHTHTLAPTHTLYYTTYTHTHTHTNNHTTHTQSHSVTYTHTTPTPFTCCLTLVSLRCLRRAASSSMAFLCTATTELSSSPHTTTRNWSWGSSDTSCTHKKQDAAASLSITLQPPTNHTIGLQSTKAL